MRETRGNPEHLPVLFCQLAAEPMTKLWRADPNIDGYVEKGSSRTSDQLSLCVRLLVMQSPKHATRRSGVVVLHERPGNPRLPEALGMPGLHEETALVGEDVGLDDQDSGEWGLDDLQGGRDDTAGRMRYCLVMHRRLALASPVAANPNPDALRVVVVSDAPLVRAGLLALLGGFGDLDLGEADSSRSHGIDADVLLSHDVQTAERAPSLVLVTDAAAAADALSSGARGVLARDASPRRIHAALHAVAESEVVVDDGFANALLPHPRSNVAMIEPLTPRERQVLQFLAAGLTNKEIAKRLGVTDHTIKFHVNGILGKLGASTRTEAVVEAARRGIVSV